MKDTTTLQDYGIAEALKALGLKDINPGAGTGTAGPNRTVRSSLHIPRPTAHHRKGEAGDGGRLRKDPAHSGGSFQVWRNMPAPETREIVRQIGEQFRKYKDPLGKLVSYEMGKSLQEGLGKYRR